MSAEPFLAKVAAARLPGLLELLEFERRGVQAIEAGEVRFEGVPLVSAEEAAARMPDFLRDVVLPRAATCGQWLVDVRTQQRRELDADERELLLALRDLVVYLREWAERIRGPRAVAPPAAKRWQPAVDRALDFYDFADGAGPFRFCRFTTLQAACFVLSKAGGLSTREIAALAGCAQSTVREHLAAGERKYQQMTAQAHRWAEFNGLTTVTAAERSLRRIIDRVMRQPPDGGLCEKTLRGRRPLRADLYEIGEAGGFIESLHSQPPTKRLKHEDRVGLHDCWENDLEGRRVIRDLEGIEAGDEAIPRVNRRIDYDDKRTG